ncbi:ABC transporter ATP-binding protein [Thermoflavimicrobium dichotomicum]|uniref:Molybdate transport system ATP-binding protein n=1 Tax=Thermoflavimicrobium dichotomicum TaxID=46223 RepID=A0A1I3MY17_9BACL|nr:ATP-binding cassette domain-containing protein [Thermoflavimicrobium dichotomicum]SFJ01888.1 molybdate transport system ATP-binding protein [Thermoflavimicrobium dichotomicum]
MLTVQIQKQLAHFQLDISFQLKQQILVLFGPSGSGKTTILNCIAGLVTPDSGSIVLNDRVFFAQGQKPLPPQKRNVGYLFQDYALFPHMTVEKNIRYGLKIKNQKDADTFLRPLLQILGIEHLRSKYPHQISGGEKQRVALARALATEPSILLLDEPLSALDQKTRIQCQDELLRLHQMWRIPFIIVTHDLNEAKKLGDIIIYLEQGKIIKKEEKERINEVASTRERQLLLSTVSADSQWPG